MTIYKEFKENAENDSHALEFRSKQLIVQGDVSIE